MDKVWATFRTFGVLLGLWTILTVVGIIAGVVPLEGLQREPAAVGAAGADGGLEAAEAPSTGEDAGPAAGQRATAERDGGAARSSEIAASSTEEADPEAGSAPAGDEPEGDADGSAAAPSEARAGVRWSVCAGSRAEPSLSVIQIFADARPEIVVGCPGEWHVVGMGSDGPARVAVLVTPDPPSGQRTRTGPAASGDVDGDGHPDVVLPLAYESDNGASRGGGLYWVPRSNFGGVRDPVALAPIAAVDAALTPLDDAAGADIVAMNRTNALAQLRSEAWVFGGGAAPTRLAALLAGMGGLSVRLADMNRDGHSDVIALSDGRVDLHFGDGRGAFERSHVFEIAGAREIATGDLDGDGGADLAVLGEGLRWFRAGSLSGMEPRGVDGVPATLRGLQVLDVDGDGKLDFTGWDHPRVAVLRHRGEVAFELTTGLSLASGSFGPRRHLVTDLDDDGVTDDLVLLGTTAPQDAPLELILLVDALDGRELAPGQEARELPNAPLVLHAALP